MNDFFPWFSVYGGVLEFSLKDLNGTKIKFEIPNDQSGIELEFPPVPLDDPVTEEVDGITTNKTYFGMLCSILLIVFFFSILKISKIPLISN